jgi:hypothetical protein
MKKTKIKRKGPCVICGEVGRLTSDHVPPKGAVPPDSVLVQAFTSYISSEATNARPAYPTLDSRSFPTLCEKCNSKRLGLLYDPHLIAFANDVARWLRLLLDHDLSLPRNITVSGRPASIARAVMGHLLAADENPSRTLAEPGPLRDAMRSFFLEPDAPPPPQLRLHVWPYPLAQQVLLRQFAVSTLDEPRYPAPISGCLLKFFPLAFLATRTSVEVPGVRFGSFDLATSDEVDIELPLERCPRPGWPERIQGDEVLLLGSDVAYVATGNSQNVRARRPRPRRR